MDTSFTVALTRHQIIALMWAVELIAEESPSIDSAEETAQRQEALDEAWQAHALIQDAIK